MHRIKLCDATTSTTPLPTALVLAFASSRISTTSLSVFLLLVPRFLIAIVTTMTLDPKSVRTDAYSVVARGPRASALQSSLYCRRVITPVFRDSAWTLTFSPLAQSRLGDGLEAMDGIFPVASTSQAMAVVSVPALLPSPSCPPARRTDLVSLKLQLAELLTPEQGLAYWSGLADFFTGRINRNEWDDVMKRAFGRDRVKRQLARTYYTFGPCTRVGRDG